MTISLCQSFCSTPPNNYPLAGVEYGRECYCGNTIQPESTSGASGCTIPCAGDATEICGGGERLNVFNNTAWVAPALTQVFGVKLLGCYKEPEGGRAVVGFMYGDNALTVESCVAECSDRGYSIAGAEFGRECWCGNSLSVEAEKLGDEFCGMRCIGDESQLCGGVGYIVVYDGGSDAGPEPEPEPSTVMRAGSVRITAEDEMKAEGGLFSPLGGPLASGDAVEESGEPLDEEGEEEFVSPTGLDLGGEPLEPMETMTTVAPPVATPSVVGAVRWEE